MKKNKNQFGEIKQPDRVISYFKKETAVLIIVTFSGITCNVGMLLSPYFEGKLAQCLFDIINGKLGIRDMFVLCSVYLCSMAAVQAMRAVKRFYVRKFANNTSRNMRHILYNSLVFKNMNEIKKENTGSLMTKAIADVDACAEGMRKFVTEIFDTGVLLISYICMLCYYDYRLAAIAAIFTPLAYIIATRLKKTIYRLNLSYKVSAGKLNSAIFDRITNAVTYRAYGAEETMDSNLESYLTDYEKKAVRASIFEGSAQPVYNIISMTGVIAVIFLGAKNVLGTGFTVWNIAAFTTFLACFTKMANKASHAANLFNALQKAEVSWKRIKPFLKTEEKPDKKIEDNFRESTKLEINGLGFAYENGKKIFADLDFSAVSGEVIGVTGPIASGKSTFGKTFTCQAAYSGSILINGREISKMSEYQRSLEIGYLGHDPELMSDTVENNIRLSENGDVREALKNVCLLDEIDQMPDGIKTFVGNGGVRLSGGQQARLALARTIYEKRRILVLDDPFAAVDSTTESEILHNIKKLYSDGIIILISHRLTHFSDFNRVIWINDGKIDVSAHEELIKNNEIYRSFYASQTKGGIDLDETR
jgi:ATP-binding cassette, subfamily B, multidrug efflux pump